MRVLITGASGLLGRAVVERFQSAGHDVLGLAKTRAAPPLVAIDLLDEARLAAELQRFQPEAIIHCAAERRPDVVQGNPEASHALNVEVPGTLARLAAALDVDGAGQPLMVNISTDYVFDGTSPPYGVDDEPNPLNAYGSSKWDGERAVAANGVPGRSTSWRVPVLYGKAEANNESAVNCLLDALVPRTEPLKMDAVAVRYPTAVTDVARALEALCSIWRASLSNEALAVPPILHFSAREAMSKLDMCYVLARIQRSLSEPASIDHLDAVYEPSPSDTSRPKHVKLDCSGTEALGIDITCTPFEDWWTPYLTELAAVARAKREAEAKAAAEEAERQRKIAEAEAEAERQRLQAEAEAEAERKRQEEAEAERRRQEAEAEAEAERKRLEEAEAERLRVEEERRREEEAELARREEQKRAEEKAQRETDEKAQAELAAQQAQKDAADAEAARAKEEERQQDASHERGQVEAEEAKSSAPQAAATPDPSAVDVTSATQDEAKQPDPAPVALEEATREASGTMAADEHAQRDAEPVRDDAVESTAQAARPRVPGGSIASPSRASSSRTESPVPPHMAAPTSPNPSFNSLQARPTPPATSGRNSPESSRSRNSIDPQQTPDDAASQTTEAPSTVVNGDGEPKAADPLAPGAAPPSRSESTDAGRRSTSLLPSLAAPRDGPDLVNAPEDGDSDGYGQPSPRESSHDAFPGGYGEVTFGLASEASTSHDGPAPQARTDAVAEEAAPARPWFVVKVGDPQKKGDPMTAHIVYTVRTKTSANYFRSQQFSVLRRYSDFRWLHAALVHNNPGVFIPPVPEKVRLARFAPELVEARRHGLENCINKIANHALLQDDEDLRLFLHSDNFAADVKLRDIRKGPVPTPEQKTYFGWSSSMSAPKFHEFDEWFDAQKIYLDHLEGHLKQLVKAVNAVSQQRRETAAATSELSHSIMMLSGSSLSRSLSTCFAGLGEVERRTCELADIQAEADARELGSVLYEYERIVGSIRKAFATRVDVWQAWQRSDEEGRKARIRHEKLGREGRVSNERLHSSLLDVTDAEGKALALKRDFDLVGLKCKEEMARFDHEKVTDLRAAVDTWLQGQIERQQELIGEWAQYCALLERQTAPPRPEASAAPPTEPAPEAQSQNGAPPAKEQEATAGPSTESQSAAEQSDAPAPSAAASGSAPAEQTEGEPALAANADGEVAQTGATPPAASAPSEAAVAAGPHAEQDGPEPPAVIESTSKPPDNPPQPAEVAREGDGDPAAPAPERPAADSVPPPSKIAAEEEGAEETVKDAEKEKEEEPEAPVVKATTAELLGI